MPHQCLIYAFGELLETSRVRHSSEGWNPVHRSIKHLGGLGPSFRMGRAARAFAEANRVDEPFTAVLDSEALRRQLRKKKRLHEQLDSTDASVVKTLRLVQDPEAANEIIEDAVELDDGQQGALAD